MALRIKDVVRSSWREAGATFVALALATAVLVRPAHADDPLLQEATEFFGQVLQLETGGLNWLRN